MAWSNISGKVDTANGGGGTTTNTGTFGANVTSGNLLIVAVASGSNAVTNVTDTVGTSYSNSGVTNNAYIYYGIAGGSGANTVSVTFSSASNFPILWLYEFSGNASSSPLDKHTGTTGNSTAVNSGATATTTNASELLFGFLIPTADMSAGGDQSGWTVLHDHANSGSATQYEIVSSTGAYSATGTSTTSAAWTALIATFLPSSATTLDPGPITGTMNSSGVVTTRLIGPTFIQGKTSDSSTTASVSVAFPSNQTAGNLNVVFIAPLLAGVTITSVTDSHSQTYTKAIGPISQAGGGVDVLQAWIYYSANIAAGANTITVLFSAANNFPEIDILEYSGLATSSPLDVTGSAHGASGTSSVSVTTTNSNDIVVAGFFNDGSGWNGTPGTGFTNRLFDSGSGNQVDDQSVTAAGTYTDTPTNLGGVWLGIAAAFKVAGASNILRPGPITGLMTSSGTAFPRVPIRVPITGTMVSSGVVHGTAHTPFLMFSSGAVNVHTVRRQPPIPGVMLSSGVVTVRLIGTVFPKSKGLSTSSGVVNPRLNPLRIPITGSMTSSGVVSPHVGIVRETLNGHSTSSGVVIPRLIYRPVISGTMRSSGGATNPRTVTRPGPVSGTMTSSGTLIQRQRWTAFGSSLSSGVVTPRLIGTVFPTAIGTMTSSGVVIVELQPTRLTLTTRTMLSSGRVNVNLVTPVRPPVIVASTGYYAVIDTWGGNLVVFLTAGVDYSATYQTVLGGPYASYWIGIQALIQILEAIPEV
jgi:hypothetical protein